MLGPRFFALFVTLSALGSAAVVVTTTTTAKAAEGDAERAKRHFDSGVKLYTDKNYAGALAEFEAAYRLKPGVSSLKNIALCQKGLFRYAEAAATLRMALEKHGPELSAQDRTAIEAAADELSGLVGSVVVRSNVATARITLGGRALTQAEISKPMTLNVGEHTFTADAPGYAKVTRVVRVAGGQKDQLVDLSMQAIAGFITVKAQHPDDAIGIDEKGIAFGSYFGPLAPGEHIVQVYREGHKSFDKRVVVTLGQTTEILAPVLEPDDDAPSPATPGTPQKPAHVRGWYGLLTLSGLGLRNDPDKLDIDNASASGGAIGVRAGYRVWTPIAVELMLDSARHDIKGACDLQVEEGAPDRACGGNNPFERDLQLDSFRLGPNLRIMSGGEKLRFTSTLGAGAVRHQLELGKPKADDPNANLALPAGEAKGWDPYFMLEVGAQYNWGHVLLELDLLVLLDGASNTVGSFSGGTSWEPFADTGGLLMGGLGLRVGWSEWTPDSARAPAQNASAF